MRAIFLILIVAVVGLIAAFHYGLLGVAQTRTAEAPQIEAGDGKIQATGGQTPKFEVQTGSVGVGTRETNVTMPSVTVNVPAVEVRRAGETKPAPPPKATP